MIRWHKADLPGRMYCNIDGKKISMPRYYKLKIYADQERKAIAYWAQIEEQLRIAKMAAAGTIPSARDKAETDIAAFRKMHIRYQSDRNKI